MSENRVKSTSARRHSGKCLVCHHQQRHEIEHKYLDFESEYKIASEHGVSHDAVNRHAKYFGLDQRRAADTEKLLRAIIARGFSQLEKVSGPLLMEAIKEFGKQAGKRKEAAKNPNDLEEAKRILDFHRRINGKESDLEESQKLSDRQIYEFVIRPICPGVRAEQLEIENSPDLEL